MFGGVLAANVTILLWSVFNRPPAWNDWLFYVWQITYFGPLTALLFTRRRGIDLAVLVTLILFYLVNATHWLHESNWGTGTPM